MEPFYDYLKVWLSKEKLNVSENTLKRLKQFASIVEETKGKHPLRFDLEETDIQSWLNFLRGSQKYSDNSAYTHFKSLKRYLFWGMDNFFVTKTAFIKFHVPQVIPEAVFLYPRELKDYFNSYFSTPHHRNVQDLFCLMADAGVTYPELQKSVEFEYTHEINSDKRVSLFGMAKEVFAKEELPHVISSQKFNHYLKESLKLAGITRSVLVDNKSLPMHEAATIQTAKNTYTYAACILHSEGVAMRISRIKHYKTLSKFPL